MRRMRGLKAADLGGAPFHGSGHAEYLASGADEEAGDGKTTYFKSVGMGLFDVCIAQKILEQAKER